jgi:hypothetical protein
MRRQILKKVIGLTIISLGIAHLGWAHHFLYPPETEPFIYDPEVMGSGNNRLGWTTQFPYQRNIYWDFSEDPRGEGGPLPGAIYEGEKDSSLWDSDFVEFFDGVSYFTDFGEFEGLIGIYGAGAGEAIFHLDNLDTPYLKHIYLEAVVINSSQIPEDNWGPPYLSLPSDYYEENLQYWGYKFTKLEDIGIETSSEAWYLSMWFEVVPNPPFEEVILPFYPSSDNEYVLIDELHIATECIPEPATIFLLGCGLLAMGKTRKIFKNL